MFHKACKQSTDGLSVTQRCRGGEWQLPCYSRFGFWDFP